jgi:hypothetical protein
MCYPPRQGTFRCITHPFATRHQGCPRAAVRLACVKHAASVQSEPGSNSSVQFLSARLASPLGSARPTGRSSSPESADEPQPIRSPDRSSTLCIFFKPPPAPSKARQSPSSPRPDTSRRPHQMPTPIGSLLTMFLKNALSHCKTPRAAKKRNYESSAGDRQVRRLPGS